MADKIDGEIGDDAEGVAAGKDIQQANPRQNSRSRSDPSQNLYMSLGDSDRFNAVYLEINKHAQQIAQHAYQINDMIDKWREVAFKLDNTPEKLDIQTERITQQNSRIQTLENRALEVVVRPGRLEPEVIIRPTSDPGTLTNQQLGRYMLIGFVVIAAAVLYLVWLQATRQ